jgi:cell cycle arrest protein BUB3
MKSSLKLDPQTDGISLVRFSPDNSLLLVTSWDGGATLYNTQGDQEPRTRYAHAGAVLCGNFDNSGEKIFTGGLDKIFRSFQVETEGSHRILGRHNAAIRCCDWISANNTLVTGSWDKTMKIWDQRLQTAEVMSIDVPERVFALDVCDHTILLGLADGTIHAFDVRSLDVGPFLARPCTIGHQIRCVKMFERASAVLIGSIEGRVSVENLEVNAPIAKRYAFKCHRVEETVYPVNTIALRPPVDGRASLFVTGGGDGTVVLWDAEMKKKIYQFPNLDTSCSSLDFSKDGTSLAVASSYAYESGDISHPPDRVLIMDASSILG